MLLLGAMALTPMAASFGQPEPAMRLSWQLSVPGASEEERDLLRREYRLTQASSEFWEGFDGLNARIHGAAELLRSLRGVVEGAAPPVRRAPSLLDGLDAPAAAAPLATSLPSPSSAPAAPPAEEGMAAWVLAAAVLGGLTFLWFRRRAAVAKSALPARAARAASRPASAQPAGRPPAPSPAPPQPADGMQRDTAPLPAAAPETVDREREEMDHALDLAEVMLSYGRTTGAMQALRDYLRDHPTNSVRPWLKLLDLHRQTGMREDFERAAETVHRHFNVRVPGWDEGVSGVPLRDFFEDEEQQQILGLEQLPHILAQVQATWPGAGCLEYLRHLLVDNRGGGRMGFPVSVVAEILLLEDILNDRLAGHASHH
jgi:hypothetical protein